MLRPRSAGHGVHAAIAGLLVLAVPTGALAQTLDDLDRLEDEVEGIGDELDAATARYERTWARIEAIRLELSQLRARTEELDAEVAANEVAIARRARSAFKRGATSDIQLLLAAHDPQDVVERAGLLAALQLRSNVGIEQATAARTRLGQIRALVADRERELRELQAVQAGEARALRAHFEEAAQQAATMRDLVSRQRRIDRGPQQGIYACIFDPGVSRFRDTWGAPRSGGRRHEGTDVFAAHRAPVYAITSGVIERRSSGGLGGIGLYLRGDDGNLYYYAHLDAIEQKGQVGTRVVPGDLIARNGHSGNADSFAPHVHLEIQPGGGAEINPYPWLAAACL